jgi:hypothetical protein
MGPAVQDQSDGYGDEHLNYEIESWNANGPCHVWVRVPVLPGTGTGSIWATWGDAADSNRLACTTNGDVWADGFRSVYHFNESSGNALDATINRCVATNTGITYGTGYIGGSALIDAETDTYLFAQVTNSVLSASVWYYYSDTGSDNGWNTVFVRDGGGYHHLLIRDSDGHVGFYNGTAFVDSLVTLSTGNWYFFTVAMSGTTYRLYMNGNLIQGPVAGFDNGVSGQRLSRMSTHNGTAQAARGKLDEARIDNVLRSSNWVWACWMNQASNTVFNRIGTTEGTPIKWTGPGVTNATASTAEGFATLVGTNGNVSLFWDTTDKGKVLGAWGNTNFHGLANPGLVSGVVMSNLVVGQTYVCRFYARNATLGVDAWSDPVSFSGEGAPEINNLAADSLTPTSARLRGNLISGSPAPNVRIYWGTEEGNTNDTASWNLPVIDLGSPPLGEFGYQTNGLPANKPYWYRCYASNVNGQAWAPASTNFTTAPPVLTVSPTAVVFLEGALGTTGTVTYTVSVSATSVVAMSVNYATADGSATTADNDYLAASGTLIIPASNMTGQISVQVLGDNRYETNQTFYVNLSSPTNATVGTAQVSCTITNDDWSWYVRGDGSGSDLNDGSDWAHAFATLQKALTTIPGSDYYSAGNVHGMAALSVPKRICVQASSGSQAYGKASRSSGAFDPDFQGGWENVDAAPAQTGYSVVTNATGPGISTGDGGHGTWRRVGVNRFVFTNVTRAVEMSTGGGTDGADILLYVSNTVIRSKDDGIYVNYGRTYTNSYGGRSQLVADKVDIIAGIGTAQPAAHGIAMYTPWMGTLVTATGTNAATGKANVSTIKSFAGQGIYLSGANGEANDATFSNLVVYGCQSNGIFLTSIGPVQARLNHCTLVENGADAVRMAQANTTAGSYCRATNSIFMDNLGRGLNVGTNAAVAFTCSEGYNVFFNDDIVVNGSGQSLAASSSAADPLLYRKDTKPAPWYMIGAGGSSAFFSASDGGHRGAYQEVRIPAGTVILMR